MADPVDREHRGRPFPPARTPPDATQGAGSDSTSSRPAEGPSRDRRGLARRPMLACPHRPQPRVLAESVIVIPVRRRLTLVGTSALLVVLLATGLAGPVGAASADTLGNELMRLTNLDRTALGKSAALADRRTLVAFAQGLAWTCPGTTMVLAGRSVDMARRDYFSHSIKSCLKPDGTHLRLARRDGRRLPLLDQPGREHRLEQGLLGEHDRGLRHRLRARSERDEPVVGVQRLHERPSSPWPSPSAAS